MTSAVTTAVPRWLSTPPEHNPTRRQILQLLDDCWQRFSKRVNPEPLLDLPCPSGFALIAVYEHGPQDSAWGVSHTRNEEREVSWHEAMAMFIAGQMVTFSTHKDLMWGRTMVTTQASPTMVPSSSRADLLHHRTTAPPATADVLPNSNVWKRGSLYNFKLTYRGKVDIIARSYDRSK